MAAATGVFTLMLGSAALVLPPGAAANVAPSNARAADPPGNNGVIKVEGVDIDDMPNNKPHQGCTFLVEFYNYDQNPDYTAKVSFEDQAPTSDGGLQVVSGDLTPFIGEDAAGGGNDLDARVTYTLKFTGPPHPQQGYHVKLSIEADGSIGADKKFKVFWVEGCTTTKPPTTKPPTTKPPTTKPPTTKPPTTKPPTTKPTKPPVTRPTTRVPETTATHETTAEPTHATAVPTEVEAGLAGDPSTERSSGPMKAVGGALLTTGGLLLAAGAVLLLRRRGKHSL
ncbi:hypothetical protein [Kribbella sp. NPDC023855]|uniref:hypothetical protein n=1 Tax=Kribbella sp. NPDC023855 TaxID=3154698 RepID=UPI0033C052B9